MATLRKNKRNQWVVSIQSLGFNTTLSTKSTSKVEANRILRKVESRVDQVKLDGEHSFHSWSKNDQLAWIKTGAEPKQIADDPISVNDAVDKYLDAKKGQNRAFNTINAYSFDLAPAKDHFAKHCFVIYLVPSCKTGFFILQNQLLKRERTVERR